MAKTLGTVIRYSMQDVIRTGGNDDAAKVTHLQLVMADDSGGPPGEMYGTEGITWSANVPGQQDGEVTFSYQFGELSSSTTIKIAGFVFGSADENGNNFTELGEGEFTATESVTVTSLDTVHITVTGIKIELAEQGN